MLKSILQATKEKFFIILSTNKTMFGQQSAYILGIVNLFLAGIAILCVVQAQEHPEYFSLIYIAVSIFIFYMVTILIIIVLQIIETCQEQEQNQSSLEIQIPLLTTQMASQLTAIIDENLTIPTESKIRLPRSQTLPLILSSSNPHSTSSISALPSTLKDFKYRSSELKTTSTHLTLLPKYQQTLSTIHKNYQSFAFITNDHHYPS